MCGRNYSCQSESGRSCWVWWQIMPAAEVIPLGLLELQAFQKSVISLWLYPKHHKLRHVLFSARGEQGLLCWGCKTFLMVSLGVVPNWREILDASPSVRWQDIDQKKSSWPSHFSDCLWQELMWYSESIDLAAIYKCKSVECSLAWWTSSPWPSPWQVAFPHNGHNLETGGLHCCYLGITVNHLQVLQDYPLSQWYECVL